MLYNVSTKLTIYSARSTSSAYSARSTSSAYRSIIYDQAILGNAA